MLMDSLSYPWKPSLLVGFIAVAGCASDPAVPADAGSAGDTGVDVGAVVDAGAHVDAGPAAELPADRAEYGAWLATSAYRTWLCDAAPQDPLPDSPHGRNVICINPTLAAARGGTGMWPVGSAAVKITFDAAGREGARLLDVRVSDAAAAAGWHFLMRAPTGETPVVGLGSNPMVASACVGCHSSAARDYVRRVP